MGAFREDAETPVLKGHRVAVVGGGNVAMDAVRTAQRFGRRRGDHRLPPRAWTSCPPGARRSTTPSRKAIRFELLTAPLEVLGDEAGWVRGLRCQRMELGEPDESGRRRPVPIPGSEFVIECEMVVVAIGTRANPLLTASVPDLKLNQWGYIVVDEDGMTSIPGIFAGGDIVRGAATVILAMGDGKRAAGAIDRYFTRVTELAAAAAS